MAKRKTKKVSSDVVFEDDECRLVKRTGEKLQDFEYALEVCEGVDAMGAPRWSADERMSHKSTGRDELWSRALVKLLGTKVR